MPRREAVALDLTDPVIRRAVEDWCAGLVYWSPTSQRGGFASETGNLRWQRNREGDLPLGAIPSRIVPYNRELRRRGVDPTSLHKACALLRAGR